MSSCSASDPSDVPLASTRKEVRSPGHAKMSHATAISLGLMRGKMYRGAVNRCVNLLVHYEEGCSANCAYCGLAKRRPGRYANKSFIHVEWPIFSMEDIVGAINSAPSYVGRTCISMITNGKCRQDTMDMVGILREQTRLPVSVLISPTILEKQDLMDLHSHGADKIGVAIDLATPELFEHYRGKGVSGPHRWSTYWKALENGLEVFGPLNVGAHLMVGMGETEQEMVELMSRLWGMGVVSHLFSFFAEKGSSLGNRPQPPWPMYLRIQLARYLLEENLSRLEKMTFDQQGHLLDPGLPREELQAVVTSGKPFMTTGCVDAQGQVACNRPFGNCLPDVRQWNYPYPPNPEELHEITQNIALVSGQVEKFLTTR